jgi:HSP20 family protein
MANESKSINVEKKEIKAQDDTERARDVSMFVPRSDVYEKNDTVYVIADMPGTDENSIDITLEKNVLSIDGLVDTIKDDKFSPIYTEYGVGDYHRSFVLSEEIDKDKIKATVKNGVLTLELPKSKETKTKKITVKAV